MVFNEVAGAFGLQRESRCSHCIVKGAHFLFWTFKICAEILLNLIINHSKLAACVGGYQNF
jgi:hypothetical protein